MRTSATSKSAKKAAIVLFLLLAEAAVLLAVATPFYATLGPFRCDQVIDINGSAYPLCSFYDGENGKIAEFLLSGGVYIRKALGIGVESPRYAVDIRGSSGTGTDFVRIEETNPQGAAGFEIGRNDGRVNNRWQWSMRPGSSDLVLEGDGSLEAIVIKRGGQNPRYLFSAADDGASRLQVGGAVKIPAGSSYSVGSNAGMTGTLTIGGCQLRIAGGIIYEQMGCAR